MLNKIGIYLSLALVFGLGIGFGTMVRMPGKSESYALLKDYGAVHNNGTHYLVYLPDNEIMSAEEFEALSVLRTVYKNVQIVYPSDNN